MSVSPETESLIERLPAMTVKALCGLVRERDLPITYPGQRAKADLVALVAAALRARG